MKKIVTSICMVAVVALAFTSCKKNETAQVFAFNYSTEQLVNDEGSYEKVYLDNHSTVQFEVNDLIEVFNIGSLSHAAPYKVNSSMELEPATTSSSINDNTDGNFYAFYPADNMAGLNLSNENRATFNLPPTQTCRVDAEGKPMIPYASLYMAAKDETHTDFNQAFFNFKNICGVLCLKFFSPSGKKVKSIAVTDRKVHLVGDVTLKIHEVDPIEMTTLFQNYDDTPAYQAQLQQYLSTIGYALSGDIRSTVTLDCSQVSGGGVQLSQSSNDPTRFFIVVRPLALIGGCDIVITFDDDDTFEIHSGVDNRIKPNGIKNMITTNVD